MTLLRRDDVLPFIASAVPTFEVSPEYASNSKYFTDEDGDLLLYVVVDALVRYIVRLRLEGDLDAVERLFEAVETLIRDGDQYVSELAVIGFLEELQNTNLHLTGSSPEDFVPFLRPWSRWWWDEVDLFWQAKVNPLAHPVGRARRGCPTRCEERALDSSSGVVGEYWHGWLWPPSEQCDIEAGTTLGSCG